MMRLDTLRTEVAKLYATNESDRESWATWLYENHVLAVAESARVLAKKYNANVELSEAAALLHDIADYSMQRKNPDHAAESMRIATEVLQQCGYNSNEIEVIVSDALRYHSCHADERPATKEGKVLATADSLAHLQTNFYIHAAWAFGKDRSFETLTSWIIEKIERDITIKIMFEDERQQVLPRYEMLKNLFSSKS